MRCLALGVSIAIGAGAAVWGQTVRATEQQVTTAPIAEAAGTPRTGASAAATPAVAEAIEKGARWLASVQGTDGGWGQDGGGTPSNRPGERLESTGNDVANTAVAALALLEAGPQYAPNVERALDFILRRVESSPIEGLAITDQQGTQIQRKLGPYIDTFLSSMLLGQVDGRSPDVARNARIRLALEKTVAKIEGHQLADGSWNHAGGWAPVLGTSMASRSLTVARQQGVSVDGAVLDRAAAYTVSALEAGPPAPPAAAAPPAMGAIAGRVGAGGGVGSGAGMAAGESVVVAADAPTVDAVAAGTTVVVTAEAPAVVVSSSRSVVVDPAAAGVTLYRSAQALEQLSRTPEDRAAHAERIAAIQAQLGDPRFVRGFGSMGGEEFFSYLNISDSLKRIGGHMWSQWLADITTRILELQNADGTWVGHHCITGRVAMTSAAILNLAIDRAD